MTTRDRPAEIELTPAMIEAGMRAAVNLEDETVGHLSSASVERLVVGVWQEMLSASAPESE